jgi:hypothetical protein
MVKSIISEREAVFQYNVKAFLENIIGVSAKFKKNIFKIYEIN